MANRPLKLRELRKILKGFGCWEEESRGKGDHTMFFRKIGESTFSYPVRNKPDVLVCYVAGVRRKFKLTADDGISDAEFYGS